MNKVRVGVVGVGHLGAKHLKTYHSLEEKIHIAGICDIREDRGRQLASQYNVPFTPHYQELLKDVDAVSLCVPTEAHFELAKFFLENGIHTLVEKPITVTVSQAEELITLAGKNKLKLQVGHIERFNAAFQAVKRLIHQPMFIECHRLNHFPNRSLDIGVVMDLMIHDIDIILGLVPSPIKDIHAVGINVLTPLEDIANARLTFHNGCVCNLTASRISDDVVRKIRIFQEGIYISLDYVQQEAYIYKKHDSQILKHSLPIEREEPLRKELDHFIDCILTGDQPLISGSEGKEALKVALDITRQIWKR